MEFEMTPRLVHFGYVNVEFVEECLLGDKGTQVRGHSFHCSRVQAGSSIADRVSAEVYPLRARRNGGLSMQECAGQLCASSFSRESHAGRIAGYEPRCERSAVEVQA